MLRGVLLAVALVQPALCLAVVALRIHHPFSLEWMEGAMLVAVERVLAGEPLYTLPSISYVPQLYTPLYYYVGALAAVVFEPSLPVLRGVSLLSSAACFALLYRVAAIETTSRAFGLVAACGFAACYGAVGGWFDVARVDMLFLALLLGAIAAMYGRSTASWIAAGALFALAFLAKQTGLVVSLPILVHALLEDRRRALWLVLTYGAGLGATTLLLDAVNGGWYTPFVFELPRQSYVLIESRILTFFTRDLLQVLPAAVLATVAYAVTEIGAMAARRRSGAPLRIPLLLAATAGMLLGSFGSRIHTGGYVNVLLPAYVALVLCSVVTLKRLVDRAEGAAVPALYGLAIAQLAILAYDPTRFVPSADSAAAGDRLVARIAAIEGDVFVPYEPLLATRAGKPSFAHAASIAWVGGTRDASPREELLRSVERAFEQRRFAAVIANDDWPLAFDAFVRNYEASGPPPVAEPDALWTVSGARTRPRQIFQPRTDAAPPD